MKIFVLHTQKYDSYMNNEISVAKARYNAAESITFFLSLHKYLGQNGRNVSSIMSTMSIILKRPYKTGVTAHNTSITEVVN